MDVAPTILHAMGVPGGAEMDGKPLASAFDKLPDATTTEAAAVEVAATESSGVAISNRDRRLVEERLKNLGYID